MKRHLVACHAALSLFVILTTFAVRADDGPKILKRGGLPYETRWREDDVRKYLNLPHLTAMNDVVGLSMDEIASRIGAVQEVAGYRFFKGNSHPFKLSNHEFTFITFELRREELSSLQVGVYGYRSWNDLCDELFKYITSNVELWNKIPDYYVREKCDDAYTLTSKGGMIQKWRFDLNKFYVIEVNVLPACENAKDEEKAIAEIDRVILELVNVIEGKE